MIASNMVFLNDSTTADWQQGDDYKMHFPQLPDEYGWDVNATQPIVIADDWMCTGTGYVSDIHFWGSWRGDEIGTINSFWIGIYSNVPANETVPYSHPGDLLWSRTFYPGEWKEVLIEANFTEGWYDPSVYPNGTWNKPDHSLYFQYNIVNITDAFVQWNGTIYWLAISANVTGGSWGWKTSLDHWEDDAVWSWGISNPEWVDLHDPENGTSLDMAFVITGEEFPCCNKDWDYWSNPPNMHSIPNGNVGIGTTNPQAKLHVNGSMRVDGTNKPYLFFVNTNTNKVGIGTNNPTATLEVYRSMKLTNPSSYAEYRMRSYSDIGWQGNFLLLRRYRGTMESPAAVQEGDNIFSFDIWGYDGSANIRAGQIMGKVGGPVSSGIVPGEWLFKTTDNSGNLGTRMIITSNGYIGINTTNPQYELDVEGYVQAYGYYTGDIFFQKDGKQLWRMFEDENGLYLENMQTGKVYRFVLEDTENNAIVKGMDTSFNGTPWMMLGLFAMIGALLLLYWKKKESS